MNWFDGVRPGLGPFAGVLQSPLQMLLAAAWAVGFLVSAFNLIVLVMVMMVIVMVVVVVMVVMIVMMLVVGFWCR